MLDQPHLGPGRGTDAHHAARSSSAACSSAPSAAVLDYCTSASEIPSNIDDVFIVPVGTYQHAGGNIPNAGAGDFDCYQPLVTTTNSASLFKFYKSQLEARGWIALLPGLEQRIAPVALPKGRQRRLLLGGRDHRHQVHRATWCTGPSGSIRTPKRSEPAPGRARPSSVQAHDQSAKLSG